MSSGFTWDGDFFLGRGDYLYFEMFSPQGTQLASGNYVINPQATGRALEISFGEVGFGIDTNAQSADRFVEITSGNVEVINESGGNYTIRINVRTSEDEELTGFYRGRLRYREG